MERKYKIKLLEGHTANDDQKAGDYLGNIFGNGKAGLYSLGDARKKARMFGGKLELHVPSVLITDIKVAQVDGNHLLSGVIALLGDAIFIDTQINDKIYSASIIDNIIGMVDKSGAADVPTYDQLNELSEYLTGYDYFMVIGKK